MFKAVTKQAGFGKLKKYLSYSVAAGDYNLDGNIDLVISHHGSISLWANQGDGTFKNTSNLITHNRGDTHGISFIDISNDYYPDIAVACGARRGHGKGKNLFFINNHKGGFIFLQTASPVITDIMGRGRSITPDDYNNDGLIDLLIFNHYQDKRPNRIALAQKNKLSFFDTGFLSGINYIKSEGIMPLKLGNDGRTYYVPTGFGSDSKIYTKDGAMMRNVSQKIGIEETSHISVAPFDFDDDGDLDLLIAHRNFAVQKGAGIVNGSILFFYTAKNKNPNFKAILPTGEINFDIKFKLKKDPKFLFLGRKKQHPANVPCKYNSSSSILTGKPDYTNKPGVYIWSSNNILYCKCKFTGNDSLIAATGKISSKDFQFSKLQASRVIDLKNLYGNTLYKNSEGVFEDISATTSIAGNGFPISIIPADFNNDGFEDIYQVNAGFLFSQTNPPNQLFINKAGQNFREVAKIVNATGGKKGIGNGAIAFDYDNDGDLDLFLYNGYTHFPLAPGPIILLQNQQNPNHANYVTIKLNGITSNNSGWGATITSYIGRRKHIQQKYSQNGFLSTSDLVTHIGMGDATKIDQITIKWPSGITQNICDIKANSQIAVNEPMDSNFTTTKRIKALKKLSQLKRSNQYLMSFHKCTTIIY